LKGQKKGFAGQSSLVFIKFVVVLKQSQAQATCKLPLPHDLSINKGAVVFVNV
jgi:hypothetical protein